MKVQDITKECSATVGLSVELSISEAYEIGNLADSVENAIQDALKQQVEMMKGFEQGCHPLNPFADTIPVAINLDVLRKVHWLLNKMAKHGCSDLFAEAAEKHMDDIVAVNREALAPNATALAA